ncbi:MAG TPA: pilus assembly protein PilQ [Persephonella sp.]|nr:pilus assembly protein PilQ [Hydrogenothermaceae bacterium]HIQ25397.1 pilus assembly protein PilQ [Persephonella sp.]
MGKNVLRIFILVVLFINFVFAEKLRISVEFYGAKLGTAIDALSKITNKNVIWDTSFISKKDTKIYVSIRKPLSAERVFKEILKENGLTYVKQKGIYKIYLADSYIFTVPRVVIEYLGKDIYSSIVDIIKNNTNSTAEIKEYKDTYSIYVRDTKENIEKIKKLVNVYVEPFQKEAEKIAKAKEKEERRLLMEKEFANKLIKKEIKLSIEEFKNFEDNLIETLSDFGKYKYNEKTKTLIIWDTRANFQKISKLLAKLRKIKVITKCFYVRSLEPAELLINIKENYLSKYGSLVFKSKVQNNTKQSTSTNISNLGVNSQIITSLPKVCITDSPSVIKKLREEFIGILLNRPYQISIEARIVQIESNFKRNLGIQWGVNYQNSLGSNKIYSISSGFTGSNFIFDFPSPDVIMGNGMSLGFSIFETLGLNRLDLTLTALEDIGKSKILSRPRIITIDGEPAEISQGIEVPYQSTSANFGTNIQFKRALLKLNVIPRTLPDGNIVMTITLTQDVPDFGNAVLGQPPINTKSITSKVVAKDGSTIVIGGILEKKESKNTKGVPGLHKMPLLGWLFKNQQDVKSEKELLIFISPKIIYE